MANMPLKLAWLATFLAAAFGVGSRFFVRSEFDPIVALTMLSVVGLVWYTYFTRQTLEHTRSTTAEARETRRRALSSAVLAELWGLTARLRVLRDRGPSALTPELISHPITALAAADPAIFQVSTVHALAVALRRIRDVQVLLESYPDLVERAKDQSLLPAERQAAEDKRVQTMQGIRIRSAWAFNRIATLVERLNSEGGTVPSALDEPETNMFDIPKLVDDPFGRTP